VLTFTIALIDAADDTSGLRVRITADVLRFSTKAWYAAFLLSKNRIIGSGMIRHEPLQRPSG
jgi:hypothetical protein